MWLWGRAVAAAAIAGNQHTHTNNAYNHFSDKSNTRGAPIINNRFKNSKRLHIWRDAQDRKHTSRHFQTLFNHLVGVCICYAMHMHKQHIIESTERKTWGGEGWTYAPHSRTLWSIRERSGARALIHTKSPEGPSRKNIQMRCGDWTRGGGCVVENNTLVHAHSGSVYHISLSMAGGHPRTLFTDMNMLAKWPKTDPHPRFFGPFCLLIQLL